MKQKLVGAALFLAVLLIGKIGAARVRSANNLPDFYEKVKYGMMAKEVDSSLGKKHVSARPVGENEMRVWKCTLGDYYVMFDSQTNKATSAFFRRTAPETFLERISGWLGSRPSVTQWYLF